jgi:hypothetical protein
VGLDLSIMVVLHVVFIRMRVVMDLQTVAVAGREAPETSPLHQA